ncbi:alginate lyase family protein [Bacillus mycoides]|uniref:alginate lyase family protein n=1 Tax=Bacillus mycoides TaxID=1405 RepID=UPI001C0155C2|nr:alginate lyase family protein [Bacillus mycoides]QWH03518.1 alginate lyase family protein [Bacillus mycoides]
MRNISNKLEILQSMPLEIIVKKVFKKSYRLAYYPIRSKAIQLNPINLDKRKFGKFQSVGSFFVQNDKIKFYNRQLKKMLVNEEIINSADDICDRTFNLLGSERITFTRDIPWNTDFKTGFVWENKFYKYIEKVNLDNDADVKVPWELSRFQHIFTLGKAYWLTEDEKYAIEFKNQIKDWMLKNPVEMSVNWTCSMEVAIRSINWIIGYYFFEKSSSIDPDFWLDFNASLYCHGKFIYKNLENEGGLTGNHYLSNIVGLIWLGLYFRGFKYGRTNRNNPINWLKFGVEELEKEMDVQVNNDGTNYESSTAYHRLVTEMFLLTFILCKNNKVDLSESYEKKLEKMCEFLLDITKPDGTSPIIGDADDGRIIIFSNYYNWAKNDFRHLLGIAGYYFNRSDFMFYGKEYKEDILWVFGDYVEKEANTVISSMSKAYYEGGYYILKSEKVYCIIRCGELAFRGRGTHSHNDQLSFELNVNGEDFIIDPGCYAYTSDYKMRNLFRSTDMHNTITLNNLEQNEFQEKNLFVLKEQTFAECKNFNEKQFIGSHSGYKQKCDALHERGFDLATDVLEVKDYFIGDDREYKYSFNLILSPQIKISPLDNGLILKGINCDIKMVFQQNVKIKVQECLVAQSYGCKQKSKKIIVQGNGKELMTKFYF